MFDDGRTIRTEELKGCIRCSSLHAMAGRTFNEGDRPLHRTRYTEQPEGVFLEHPEALAPVRRGKQKCVSSRGDVSLEGIRADTPEKGPLTPAAEMRFGTLGDGYESVSPRPVDRQEVRLGDGHEAHRTETRRCESCGGDFRPGRAWSRFCSSACRLRVHRRLVTTTRGQSSGAASDERPVIATPPS